MKLSRCRSSDVANEINIVISKLGSIGISSEVIHKSSVEIRRLPEDRPIVDYIFCEDLEVSLTPHNGDIYHLCMLAIVGIAYLFEIDEERKNILGDEFEIRYESAIELPNYISSALAVEQTKKARKPRPRDKQVIAERIFKDMCGRSTTGPEFEAMLRESQGDHFKVPQDTVNKWLKKFKDKYCH